MKNTELFVICAIACFPPWAMLFKPFGLDVQLIGLAVQFIGLSVLIIKRKQIF